MEDHKKAPKEDVSAKKECPLSTLIVKVKTSKGKRVGQAEVKVLKGTKQVSAGPTNDAKGEYDTGKVLQADSYTIKVKRKCHKPKEAEKTNVPLGENDKKEVELTLDPYEIKITAKKASYTVVVDKSGNEVPAHPILEFEITGGPPNHFFDIQLSRDLAAGLTGGPGLGGAWDEKASRDDRVGKTLFSSWSNDEKLQLDPSGKTTYKMPLEWWRDLARITRDHFDKKDFYYRVLAMDDDKSAPCAQSAPDGGASAHKVQVKNNLQSFTFTDSGYTQAGDEAKKNVRFEFTVRENDTGEMYTFVQWKKGTSRNWSDDTNWEYNKVKDYLLVHKANMPEWSIDRLETNPRYWNGPEFEGAGNKTGYCTDKPNLVVWDGDVAAFRCYDFDTRVHLNFEVPAIVTVTKKEPDPCPSGVYDIVIGKLADPQPVILDHHAWSCRILLTRRQEEVKQKFLPWVLSGFKKKYRDVYDMTHPVTYP
ncbi:MAG TPA: carboxypeptidase-like regulatory domain-containing protein [Sedimentisphaerales bacterium]|nr:carboxypeptidase-like regulatory domain-containing protein [Sedimentisphaerales bacterium]